MTWIDIIILIVFLIFSVLGLFRGLVSEAFGLLAWVIALYVGAHYGEIAKPIAVSLVSEPKFQGLVACLVLGVLVFGVISVIGALLNKQISASIFAPINRMLGLLFGAARGAVVIGFFTLIALQFGLEDSDVWKVSKLRLAATTSADLLDNVVDFESLLRTNSLLGRPIIPN